MQPGAWASLITADVTDTGHRMHYQGSDPASVKIMTSTSVISLVTMISVNV